MHDTLPRPIRSVALLEPQPPDIHIFSKFAMPRLGAVLLGTILRDRGYDVSVLVEDVRPFDFAAIGRADLVGISAITPTAARSYEIADQLRASGVPVVMGGPHPTHVADEAIDHADYVVRGEGEHALPALLEAIERGTSLAEVPNLTWRDDDGAVHHNPLAPLCPDLDRWPDPDMSLVEGFDNRGFLGGKRRVVPLQTSRGCPYDCAFCSVTSTFGRTMRYRSVDRIVEEMRGHDLANTLFFIYDDNFAASPKRVRELLAGFHTLPRRPRWSAQVRADVARDEALLDEMVDGGLDTVFIGLESVNQATLDNALKRQDLGEAETHLRRMRSRGISVHGMFVFGFDTDRADTMERTLEFARSTDLSSVQFLILTPLPGSRTFDEMNRDGRVLFHDWSLYDAHHVCFRPRGVTPAELQRWQNEGHRLFYSRRRAITQLLKWRPIAAAITVYAANLDRNWRRANRDYLAVLDRLSAPRGTGELPVYRRTFPELTRQLRDALAGSG